MPALHTISALPLDPDVPLFEHYPAMKLGVRQSVGHYARLLLPLAREVIASRPAGVEWVVTAPPFFGVPAGANLVAREIHRGLSDELPSQRPVRIAELHRPVPTGAALADALAGDYSRKGVDDRIENRRRLFDGHWPAQLDSTVFRGRAVLFVNDINVTGTQQSFMQQVFDVVGAASIDWLYIIQVDPPLGRSNPELEDALNQLHLGTFEGLADVVTRADIDFTCRCIRRLLAHPIAQLEPLFRTLEGARLRNLYDLAMQEGIFTRTEDAPKLALLRELSANAAALP
jgi:hypothetical protein